MRLLGIIKKIDGKPRTWTNANGETVYSFRMAFEAEGNQFLGEYTIAPQRLAQLGIRPGAVGYLDIKFSIRDYTSKTTGEAVSVQDIRFSKWSLANANQPAEAPATEAAPAADPEPADGGEQNVTGAIGASDKVTDVYNPSEQAQEASTEGTNLPF